MNVVHVVVHSKEQADQILSDAVELADTFDRDSRAWELAFTKAVDLLAARVTIQTQQAQLPVDLSHLRGMRAS